MLYICVLYQSILLCANKESLLLLLLLLYQSFVFLSIFLFTYNKNLLSQKKKKKKGVTSEVLRTGITSGVLRTYITSGGRHREVSWQAAFCDIIISSANVERSSMDFSSVLCRRTLPQLGNVRSQISFFRSTSLFFESSSVSGKRLSIQISSHS